MREVTQLKASRGGTCTQFFQGLALRFFLVLPYVRRVEGVEKLDKKQKYLFVVNHVSLLDTLILGGLAWRTGLYPILVLGDWKIWGASWLRRWLSGATAYLVERGKLNPGRIRDLQAYGRAGKDFQLIVFPEGTRGDGTSVLPCQPGIYYIAQAAQLPIVPVFIANMQHVSTKTGRFHPIAGLRQVEVHYGEPIQPEAYLNMQRPDFQEFIQRRIAVLQPEPRAVYLSSVRPAA